jgi:putative transposase
MSRYKQIYYQIVFGTKYRKPTIAEAHCQELYKYIWGVIQNKNCKVMQINGVEGHIHIFSDLHPSIALADYVKDIKVASSIWLKDCGLFPDFIGWQDGYGSFTYSIRETQKIINYIKNKKNIIKKKTL